MPPADETSPVAFVAWLTEPQASLGGRSRATALADRADVRGGTSGTALVRLHDGGGRHPTAHDQLASSGPCPAEGASPTTHPDHPPTTLVPPETLKTLHKLVCGGLEGAGSAGAFAKSAGSFGGPEQRLA